MATKSKLGCFTFPAILLLSLIGSSVIQSFFPVSLFTAFILALLLLSWLVGKLDGYSQKRFHWRYMIYSGLLLLSILGLRHMLDNIPLSIENQKSDISEYIYREKTVENGDSIVLLRQNRQWKDNYGNTFKGKFSVREKDYISSKRKYASSIPRHKTQSWGKLYQYLATTDTPKLDLIPVSYTHLTLPTIYSV